MAGAIVVLACRRTKAGEEAARSLLISASARVVFVKCDLESIESVNEVLAVLHFRRRVT
jgi:NAD(P)-dependent dehydrogenase (short-subunit alcohol dehydrogenase family)